MGVEMQSGGHSTVGWTDSVERERELASANIPLLFLDLMWNQFQENKSAPH